MRDAGRSSSFVTGFSLLCCLWRCDESASQPLEARGIVKRSRGADVLEPWNDVDKVKDET